MLRLIFATVLVVSCSTFTSATFLDTLHQVHASDAFNNLTHSDQVLVLELLSEAQAGELKIYVDDVGFENVLALLDSKCRRSGDCFLTSLLPQATFVT